MTSLGLVLEITKGMGALSPGTLPHHGMLMKGVAFMLVVQVTIGCIPLEAGV